MAKVELFYATKLGEALAEAANILGGANPKNPSPEQAHGLMKDAGAALKKASDAALGLNEELEGLFDKEDA